jgi:EmrB/QacA subfamily drug resistance transporter
MRERGEKSTESWILAASIVGSSMAFIDGTVVNVALPVLQSDLKATATAIQWVVEAYLLTLSALLLLGGSLADRLGRRRIFMGGVLLFAGSSIACAIAPSMNWLITSRAVQGVGGALLTPTSLALLGAGIPAERRGKAIGKWSGFSAATSALGPLLGGWLVQAGSWRWAFWINVPLALLTLAITWKKVPESRAPGHPRLDLPGAAWATLALGGLTFGLLEMPRLGSTHPLILGGLIGGALALAAFFWVEHGSDAPMLPLGIFKSRPFAGANVMTLFLYAAIGSALFFLPFDLIQVHRYSPAQSGAALLPLMALVALLSGWTGRLGDRYGPRRLLVLGPLIAALGYALLALPGTGGSYWTTFFPAVTVLGLGMAVSVPPLTSTVMGSVDTTRAGLASGINNAVARTASLLAIAVFGIVAHQRFAAALWNRLTPLGLPTEARNQLVRESQKLAAASVPASLSQELQQGVSSAIGGAFVEAFRTISLLAAALALAASLTAWISIRADAADRSRRSRQS